MTKGQELRLAALDRAITLHARPDASNEAAHVVATASTLTAFIESGDTTDTASDSSER